MLPLLYLHGLSSGDFVPALGQFLGSPAGLSGPVITQLTETWKAEQRAFGERDLSAADYVYLRADGIHVNIRLEEQKLCLLVMIGVRADGRKELIALADGYRESAESWADLLRDCARRGMRAPVLAAGDGALGFWNGLREVFPGDQGGPLLVPQDGERPGRTAQVRPSGREEGPGRDLGRRGQAARPFSGEGVPVSIHGCRWPRGLPGGGAGSRIGLRWPGLGSARGRTDRDGDGRFLRAWRGDLEGDAGRPGDDDAAGEAGEARPAYGQPDRVPRSREESLA